MTNGLDKLRATAQAKGAAKKKDEPAAPEIDPRLLKWLLYGSLAALFVVGIVVMFQNASDSGKEDPNARMKREMGITGEEAPVIAAANSGWDRAMQMIASGTEQIRADGLVLLMQTDAARGAPYVLERLADPGPMVRSTAARLLAEHNIAGSGAAMVSLLSDPEPAVRAVAADAMTKFAAEPGLIYLLSTPLGSPDPPVVLNAIKVLKAAAVHDRVAVAGVITGPLNSNDDQILLAALDAAWNLTQEQLKNFRGTIEAVKARKPGTPVEVAADALLEEVSRAERYAGQ